MEQQHSPTNSRSDASPPPSGVNTAVLSPELLRNTLWTFSVCLFAGALFDYAKTGGDLPTPASIGRIIASLVVAISGFLAHRRQTTSAFTVFSAVYLFALFNGTFIAGFGINSPALVVGLVPILFAIGLFEQREAMVRCTPIFAGWLLVVSVQLYNPALFTALVNAPDGQPQPSAAAWAISSLLTIIPAILITLSSRQRLEYSLQIEHRLRTEAETLLQMQSKWNQERDEFMGHVSHELRTPLAAMHNALTLARHPKATDTVREKSLTTLQMSIGNMRSLLNDVLDAFKYGSAGFNIKQSDFSPNELLLEIEALFSQLAVQKGLRFVMECETDSDTRLIGDPARIKQMLSNLILNAIKFTRSGLIVVRLTRIDSTASAWRFEVADTGPGIAHEDQQRLFKPFAQLENQQHADASISPGTGLGLSIVMQLAHAMGGHAGLTSQPGEGSTFYFEIPLPSVSKSLAYTIAA